VTTYQILANFIEQVKVDHTKFLQIPEREKLTDKEVELLLEVNGLVIRYITNPTSHLVRTAIHQNPFAIKYVSKPTLTEQLIAIESDPIAIKHIEEPDEVIALKAVSIVSNAVYFMEQPHDSVKVVALIKNRVHEKYKDEVKHGILAITYGFLLRNKINIARSLTLNDNFESIEELTLITLQIKNTLVEAYPALREVLV
jgi:hypothetical protein